MNRIEDYLEVKLNIVEWIKDYADKSKIKSLVVGVSGGIDSAVVSTLCAETGLPTYVIGMPIHQKEDQENLSDGHLDWMLEKYSNVTKLKYDLSNTFDTFVSAMDGYNDNKLALANTRSRIRMVTLYQVAGSVGGIVVGTGNKVEDLLLDAKDEAKEILEKAEADVAKVKADAEKIVEYERNGQLESLKQRVISRALDQAEVELHKDMNDDFHSTALKRAKTQIEANA